MRGVAYAEVRVRGPRRQVCEAARRHPCQWTSCLLGDMWPSIEPWAKGPGTPGLGEGCLHGKKVRGSRERVALPVPGVLLQSLAVLLIDGLHAVAALDPGGIGCGSLSSSV